MGAPTADQIAGCLIGQALGDALGVPVAGFSFAACRTYATEVIMVAMAGAISGADVGLGALLAKLTTRLNDQGEWDYDALPTLAEQAYRLKAAA